MWRSIAAHKGDAPARRSGRTGKRNRDMPSRAVEDSDRTVMLVEGKGVGLRWIVEAVPPARLTKWKAVLAPAYWSLRGRLHGSVGARARPSGPTADMASRTRWPAAHQMTHLPEPRSKLDKRCHARVGWYPDRRSLPTQLNRCDRFQQSRPGRKWRWPRPSRSRSAPESAPPARSERSEEIFAIAAASAHPTKFLAPEGLSVEIRRFNQAVSSSRTCPVANSAKR